MRAAVTAVSVVAVLATLLTGCGSSPATRVAIGPHAPKHDRLTDPEYAVAVALARREVAREDASLTSATATVGIGTVPDPNTGHDCVSTRLLHVTLIGTFPHISTTGHPVESGAAADQDFTVHAVVLTADAKGGGACLISVKTGHVDPDPGAEVLDLN